MRGFSTELKVGSFAVAVIVILAFMTFRVGGLDWLKKEGYTVYVNFRNIAGLDEKTKVKIAGVDAGIIEKIDLKDGTARLTLRIDNGVLIYRDAVASIKSSGLLGDKYLEIKIGSEKPPLKNGDSVENVMELVDVDDMVRKLSKVSDNISTLAESLNDAFGTEEAKQALKGSVLNLEDITTNLNRTIVVNDRKMRNVLDNIQNLTASFNDILNKNKGPFSSTVANMEDFSAKLKSEGPVLIANLNKATKDLREMVEENRSGIKSTVESFNSIAKKIDKGEGTIGKLVKDDNLYNNVNKAAESIDKTIGAIDRFRTFVTFQADYLSESKDGKGYFYVTLQPRPDKYYILGVVNDPLGRVTTKTTVTTTASGTTKVTKEETERRLEFTAQFAKRYHDLAMRLGLTESTFGAGADYFFNDDKGRAAIDIWDFSSDDEGAQNPHVRVGVDYYLFKNLFVSAGADNLLNSKRRGGYAGFGVRFEDEDFKYLLGTMPSFR